MRISASLAKVPVSLELRCADDAGGQDYVDYEATKEQHLSIEAEAGRLGIKSYVADSDDRYSKHSDAYLYFTLGRIDEVATLLRKYPLAHGDILDVPANFSRDLAKDILRKYGWQVEYSPLPEESMGGFRGLLDSLSSLSTLLEALISKKEFIERLSDIDLGIDDPKEAYRVIIDIDPTPSNKYAAWVLFMLERGVLDMNGIDLEYLGNLLKRFDKFKDRLEKKDLYQYSRPDEVAAAIEAASIESAEEKAQGFGTGVKRVSSKNGYEIYRISEIDACVRASSGTKWCISQHSTAAQYLEDKYEFYLIFKDGKKYAMLLIRPHTSPVSLSAGMFDLQDHRIKIEDAALVDALNFLPDEHKVTVLIAGLVEASSLLDPWLSTISDDASLAFQYARHTLRGPFPAGEPAIAKDAELSYDYAVYVLSQLSRCTQRFRLGEPTIAKDGKWASKYARDVLDGPFPEGELAIAEIGVRDGAEYARAYARYALKLPADEAPFWAGEYLKKHGG